jgi:hypothetical protein
VPATDSDSAHASLPSPVRAGFRVHALLHDERLPAALLTALLHLLLLAWLLQAGRLRSLDADVDNADTSTLWVEWIERDPEAPAALPIPPMPQAPSRRTTPAPPAAGADVPIRVTEAQRTDRLPPASAATQGADAAPPAGGRRLIDQIGAYAREPVDAHRFQRNPLEPSVRLPGRAEAFVEGVHVRESISPQDVVQAIGRFIGGGGGITCGDLRRKMASDISDVERRRLIDDERRLCRRGP